MTFFLALMHGGCQSAREPIPLDQLPSELPVFEVLVNDLPDIPGYIMVRKTKEPGSQTLINAQGQVIWYQMSDTTLFRAFYPYDQSYVALHSDKEILEVDYEGDTLNRLVYGSRGFDRTLHHELIKSGGNYVGLTKEELILDADQDGATDTVISDGILVLSPEGKKVWHWSIDQVLDPTSYPDILRYQRDWGHANALDVDRDGNYLISWRDFNEIWKVDATDGHLIWKYGGDDIKEVGEVFHKQHAIHVNRDGDYMMFDNGLPRERPTTRALAFREENGTFVQTLSVSLPDSLFSFKQGSVYQVDEDHLLFSSTQTNYLVITNRQSEIRWLVRSDTPFYRAYFVSRDVLP